MDFYAGSAVAISDNLATRYTEASRLQSRSIGRRSSARLFPVRFDIQAKRDAMSGAPIFNFPQTVWLYPRVMMNWGPRYNRNVEVLAVNILTSVIPARDCKVLFGTTSHRAIDLADLFAREVLLDMPADGGIISRDFLLDWTRAHL